MGGTVKVTALAQTFRRDGQGFGPFKATPERPFLEVPLWVALVSGAPEYTGEPESVDDDAAQVDAVIAERDHLKQVLFATATAVLDRASYLRVPRGDAQYPEGMDVHQAVAAGFDDLKAELDSLSGYVKKLEDIISTEGSDVQRDESGQITHVTFHHADGAPPELPADSAVTTTTPLPADFPMRDLLTQHGFDSLEKVRAGVQDGGVDKISGIGPATLKTIEAALK